MIEKKGDAKGENYEHTVVVVKPGFDSLIKHEFTVYFHELVLLLAILILTHDYRLLLNVYTLHHAPVNKQ